MCKYKHPRQFACIDPAGHFKRLGTPIKSTEHLQACIKNIPTTAQYLSVYGWANWTGGKITPEISKTAVIDGVFFDFDDAEDPERAIRDAAEVAAFIGDHCTTNFSGLKGAHVWIDCYPVDLIPDLKGPVLRGFANMLCDRLPELDTMDFAVIGDTSRVSRIIDSVHPGTKLHAIGLSAEELAMLSIDEVGKMAQNSRGLTQVHEPSQWVTDELYKIEGEIITERLDKLFYNKQISYTCYAGWLKRYSSEVLSERISAWNGIKTIEEEWRRIRRMQAENMPTSTNGQTPEENWLIRVVDIFKVVQRMGGIQPKGSKVSTSSSEHEARCHITKLMSDCGWTRSQMHEVFSHADDYSHAVTERQINSLIGRV